MNVPDLQMQVCSVCLVVGAELYMLQYRFKYLLTSICTKMSLELSEESHICARCLNDVVRLNQFKGIWSVYEEKFHSKVIELERKINVSELLYPNHPYRHEMPNACRLCNTSTNEILSSNQFTKVNDVSLGEMFQFALPDWVLDLTYNPIFCDDCTKRLTELYIFNKRCLETENKIAFYLDNTGINIKKITKLDLLLNVKEYCRNPKNIIKKTSSFFNYFCDVCEYKTVTEVALKNHKEVMHYVECILGSSSDSEELRFPDYDVNGNRAFFAPTNMVNGEKLSAFPLLVFYDTPPLTSVTAVIGREPSIISVTAVNGGGPSVIPVTAVNGREPSVTSVNVTNSGQSSMQNIVEGMEISITGDTNSAVSSVNVTNCVESSMQNIVEDMEISITGDTNSAVTSVNVTNSGESSMQDIVEGMEISITGDTNSAKITPPARFKCRVCNVYETDRMCNLKKHVDRHNKKTDTYHCAVCDFKGQCKDDLVKHEIEHDPPKNGPFTCEKCSFSTEKRRNLTRHLARHKKKESKAETK